MDNKKIIEELSKCAAQNAACYHSLQREGENKLMQRSMMLNQDAEAICRVAVQVLDRRTEFALDFIKLCANICEECAEECEKHGYYEQSLVCAEACRKCVEACRLVIKQRSSELPIFSSQF